MKVYIGPPRANRRVSIRIDHYDTWSMDHTIAMLILPMLVQLKADKHGLPSSVCPPDRHDAQKCFDFINHDEEFDFACKKWDEMMDKMIWSFEQITHDNWPNIPNGSSVRESEDFYNRVQEGLNLFGKYFMDLWD